MAFHTKICMVQDIAELEPQLTCVRRRVKTQFASTPDTLYPEPGYLKGAFLQGECLNNYYPPVDYTVRKQLIAQTISE